METQICPVCTGSGKVDEGFYRRTSNTWTSCGGTEKCRACDGRGYVIISEEELKEYQRGGLAHPYEFIKKRIA